jgi:hypothetical protein
MTTMTRRQLFRGSFKTGRDVSAVAVGNEQSKSKDAPRPGTELGAIAGDFPPELLSMEAERLGLAPDADRETLLTAIYEAMAGSGPASSGG